jgi:hypothetical protein
MIGGFFLDGFDSRCRIYCINRKGISLVELPEASDRGSSSFPETERGDKLFVITSKIHPAEDIE